MARTNIDTGTSWEHRVGYSRAVRVDRFVYVAGTLAVDAHGEIIAPGDAYEQTLAVLRRIEKALEQSGASLIDVVRTRMYVRDIVNDEDAIGRAHHQLFSAVRPAATMVEVQRLAHDEALIEVEVDAVVGENDRASRG